MTTNSPQFRDYLAFLLQEEGGKSSNAMDSAVKCAPYPGAVHTNKGVTFCTFQIYASKLGVLPVTYDRFLRMTDSDAAKFLYMYYEGVGGPSLPDRLAIALTEIGWGSGPETAIKTLQRALNVLGNSLVVDGALGPKTREAVNKANPKALYDALWKERERWLRSLPQFPTFEDNWIGRIHRFLKKFPPVGGAAVAIFTLAAIGLWIFKK